MNADQLKGKWMQFKGVLTQQYGKFTDDSLQQIEGMDLTTIGKVQERWGDKKDERMKGEAQWRKQSVADATKLQAH
ncbi:MAG: CsbD family protein [Nitrospirales bacterium]